MSGNPKNVAPTPKTERWVMPMVLAFVPVVAALFVPQAARIPLLAVGGVVFVAAFVQMIRHSREAGDNHNLRRLVISDSE
jgi:hypothetical protein